MVNYRELNKSLKESCKLESENFYRSIQDIKSTQEIKLSQIIRANIETDFGKQHSFNKIASVEEFRSSVPVTTYEDYEKYITQIAEGREKVLTNDKVLMLEPTSGSTSPSKFIPYTESLKREFPARERRILDTLAFSKFGKNYDSEAGIISFGGKKDYLRRGVADIDESRMKNQDIEYFVARNPHWQDGDELACLVRLTKDNFNRMACRVINST